MPACPPAYPPTRQTDCHSYVPRLLEEKKPKPPNNIDITISWPPSTHRLQYGKWGYTTMDENDKYMKAGTGCEHDNLQCT